MMTQHIENHAGRLTGGQADGDVPVASQEQKYKEGCTLLQKSLLELVDAKAQEEQQRSLQQQQQQRNITVQC